MNASAEATTLPDNSIDLFVAAQAFHWFDIPAARREFQRILKPGGSALLLWNTRKLGGTPFLEAYEKLLIAYGTDRRQTRPVPGPRVPPSWCGPPSRFREPGRLRPHITASS